MFRKKMLWLCFVLLALTCINNVLADERSPDTQKPKNIIIFVADGLGFAQLSLAMQLRAEERLWHRFSVTGWHQPHPIDGFITDSAASATALATGVDTTNKSIGVDAEGVAVENIFEVAQQLGYRTGVVTDSYIWDATPAGFTVHAKSRHEGRFILEQLAASSLDVLLGELEDVGEKGIPDLEATQALFQKRFSLLNEDASNASDFIGKPIVGLFAENQIQGEESSPTLQGLTGVALQHLSTGSKPFLLLVETEEIDTAGHQSKEKRLVRGLSAMQYAVSTLLDFTRDNPDTLFVFTSDHETGALSLESSRSNQKIDPEYKIRSHTGSVVPILAVGPGAENFIGIHTNEELGLLFKRLIK